jgi:hypothetical protein
MLNGLHQLEIRGKVLLSLNLLALKVHIKEVNIEVGLGVNSSYDDETALRGPVDTVAGLLLNRADKPEAAGDAALLLGGKE